jgi:hypothetical protein
MVFAKVLYMKRNDSINLPLFQGRCMIQPQKESHNKQTEKKGRKATVVLFFHVQQRRNKGKERYKMIQSLVYQVLIEYLGRRK